MVATKGVGWKRVFERAGYFVTIARECWTSKRCCICRSRDADNDNTVLREDPKAKVKKKKRLKRCQRKGWAFASSSSLPVTVASSMEAAEPIAMSAPHCEPESRTDDKATSSSTAPELVKVHGVLQCKKCQMYFDRDFNGAENILAIVEAALNGQDRPDWLKS